MVVLFKSGGAIRGFAIIIVTWTKNVFGQKSATGCARFMHDQCDSMGRWAALLESFRLTFFLTTANRG